MAGDVVGVAPQRRKGRNRDDDDAGRLEHPDHFVHHRLRLVEMLDHVEEADDPHRVRGQPHPFERAAEDRAALLLGDGRRALGQRLDRDDLVARVGEPERHGTGARADVPDRSSVGGRGEDVDHAAGAMVEPVPAAPVEAQRGQAAFGIVDRHLLADDVNTVGRDLHGLRRPAAHGEALQLGALTLHVDRVPLLANHPGREIVSQANAPLPLHADVLERVGRAHRDDEPVQEVDPLEELVADSVARDGTAARR